MRDKLEDIIGGILKGYHWNIEYGYDCINIKVDCDTGIYIDVFEKLEQELDTDTMLLSVANGDISIFCDISNYIIKWFGSRSKYEKEYNL